MRRKNPPTACSKEKNRKKYLFFTRGGIFPVHSRKDWNRADHLQHLLAGIHEHVILTGKNINGIACPDGSLFLVVTNDNTLPFENVHLMLFLMPVPWRMAAGGKLHETEGISRAAIICGQEKPCVQAGNSRFFNLFSGNIICVFQNHILMY